MLNDASGQQIKNTQSVPISDLLTLAAWCGLVAGLLEGVWLYLSHGRGWLNPEILFGVSLEIIWISAVVNLLVFLLLILLVRLSIARFPRLPAIRVYLFVCLFCATADWAGSSGRISSLGIVVFSAGLAIFLSGKLQSHSQQIFRFCRRSLPAVMGVTLAAFIVIEGGYRLREQMATRALPPAPNGTPNVLVIVVDTLRADHLSAYGYGRQTSPYIDELARRGVLFEHAVSTSSWTLPAHQSLLTGHYPHEIGPLREQPLTAQFPTLGDVVQRRGYRTAAFSANTLYFCRRAGFSRGFLHFEDYFYSLGDMFYRTLWGRLLFRSSVANMLGRDELPQHKLAADVNRSLLKWLDQDRARPFFAVVNYFDVHYPYAPPKRYEAKFYDGGIQLDCRIGARRTLNPFSFWDAWEQFAHLSPECLHQQMDEYDGAIAYVDDQVRALMSELQKRALDKNTLVVITSDHGESFREHGLVFHGTALYLEQIHIPLIFWAPGRIPAARRVTAPVSIASIPSTVADLLGNGSEKSFPLPSLAQLWNNAPQSQVLPPPISELVQDRYVPKESPVYQGWMKSVLDSEWHMVISEKLPTELYDWPQDPSETKDLAHDAQNTDVIRELNEKLWRELTPKKSASFPARPFHVPQDTKQAKSSGP